MDQFDYGAYADYTQPAELYPDELNTNNPNADEPQLLQDTIPAPEPAIQQRDPDEDSDIIMIAGPEQINGKSEAEPEPIPEPQPEPATPPAPALETVSLSPKTKSKKSKKSRKKRKYEEMETEQAQESIGDIISDKPLSPKRLKLDPSQSTLARLSQVQLFSDIIFNVRGVTFHGIKSIFAIKSIKLQQLMYPQDNATVNTLEINDISAIAFRFIKDFVYDMSPQLTVDNVIDVLQASELYQFPAITEQCTTFLAGIDSVNDFLKVLQPFNPQNAEIFDGILNGENAIKLLQQHGGEIISSEIFAALSFDVAKKILESDNLGVKEEEIFNKALTWNDNGDIKGIIRFTRMDIQFLYGTVKPSGILSDNDLVQIYEYKLGFIQELNGFNCNQRFEAQTSKRSARAKASATKKKSEPSTPKKAATKKKATSAKKSSTKKKSASKKKAATKRKSTRKK